MLVEFNSENRDSSGWMCVCVFYGMLCRLLTLNMYTLSICVFVWVCVFSVCVYEHSGAHGGEMRFKKFACHAEARVWLARVTSPPLNRQTDVQQLLLLPVDE